MLVLLAADRVEQHLFNEGLYDVHIGFSHRSRISLP